MVVLFFALGLMSKPMLVTLPFVLLLLDYWPLKRFEIAYLKRIFSGDAQNQIEYKNKFLNLIFEKIPLLFLVAGSCIVTLSAQKSWGAVVSIDIVPLATRISNALVSYLEYLEKMVWPKGFSVFYKAEKTMAAIKPIGTGKSKLPIRPLCGNDVNIALA